MPYRKLTHMIVFCSIIGGAVIMGYADYKKKSLLNPEPVKTTKTCEKVKISCKVIS